MDKKQITLEKWFNPCNQDHVRAYVLMLKTGEWAPHLVPDHVYTTSNSMNSIMAQLAGEWIQQVMALPRPTIPARQKSAEYMNDSERLLALATEVQRQFDEDEKTRLR